LRSFKEPFGFSPKNDITSFIIYNRVRYLRDAPPQTQQWVAGETGGFSSPLMAAEDRLFRGGCKATILCVYRNITTATGVAGGRAQAHNIIDTAATATAAANVVTSRSLSIQGSFPTVFISNKYIYIFYIRGYLSILNFDFGMV